MDRGYFNDEHKLFRKTVRSFAGAEIRPHAEEWERAGIFSKELFHKASKLGLLGIRYDDRYGGTGLDY